MIISEEQLNEVKRLLKAKNPGKEGKDLAKSARKHISQMIEIKPAKDLIAEELCNAGKGYNSATLFKTVQYVSHKKITPKGSRLNMFTYKKYSDEVWAQFSQDDKKPWATEAAIIKKMEKPEGAKPSILNCVVVEKHIVCPICCHSGHAIIWAHLKRAHFFDHQTDTNQKRLREDLEIALARNPKLVDEWNNELKAFWNYLFDENYQISSNPDYVQCKKFIDQAKLKTGDSTVYTQVQDTSAQFYCDKDSLTGIHHYAGKTCRDLRYFKPGTLIAGRVGYEFKAAIESRIPIYFFIAFENLSKESSDIFEHCVMLALFHLDYKFKNAQGLPNVWNLVVPSLPKGHELCVTDPKILIKIGLVLLHEIVHKFKASVHDKSFFESKEILAHYDNLDEAGQKLFIEQCGMFAPGDDGGNKRLGKQRKVDKISLNSGDSVQLEMTLQMAKFLVSAIDSGKTIEDLRAEAEDVINQFRS